MSNFEVLVTVTVTAKRRNHFTELFHLDNGRIRSVHAVFYYAPPGRPLPNWPPYDGLFPLPAQY